MLRICRELLSASSKHDDQDILFECGMMADEADASLVSYTKGFFFFFGRGKNFLQNTIHQNMKWTIF